MLTEAECREIGERVVSLSRADEVEVSLNSTRFAHLRFARNTPSTSGTAVDHTLSVRSSLGTRSGSATVNQLDPDTVEAVVRRSESVARLTPEDPEFMPGLGPQEYESADTASGEELEELVERMARGSQRCIDDATAAGLVAAGFSHARQGSRSLANSHGLFGYHRYADAAFSETVRTKDGSGSGWASSAANDVAGLNYARSSATAIDKARGSAGAAPLEPGDYPAILEPACVANLVGLLIGAMGARSADEGRSFFSRPGGGTKLGEELFPSTVSIYSDPNDARVPATPWGGEGLPRRRTEWVSEGRVANLSSGRFWAREKGRQPLSSPGNTILPGGSGGVQDLIRATERGVLVTNLWYIRRVDPRTLLYTGLTRDGVFWIEDGEISKPVNNFRWNDSPVRVLKGIQAMSEPVRVAARGSRATSRLVPALKVERFGFSSVSEAV